MRRKSGGRGARARVAAARLRDQVSRMPKPVHFDETEVQWALGKQKGKYDIESVALHEIGHLLGMLHNGSQESIMYPRVSDNKLARKLSADDKTGIRRLYPEWKRVGGSFTSLCTPPP